MDGAFADSRRHRTRRNLLALAAAVQLVDEAMAAACLVAVLAITTVEARVFALTVATCFVELDAALRGGFVAQAFLLTRDTAALWKPARSNQALSG